MALCVYKRIRSEPIRLSINGKTVIVRHGETVITDNSKMMGIPGFAFLRIYNQQDNFQSAPTNLSINKPPPIIETNFNEPPQMGEIQEISIETTPVFKEVHVNRIEQELPKPVPTVEPPKKSPGFETDIVTKLKSFDNKQWFALKKEEIIKFLEDANIEYKHISSDKWELLKFLKKIIKEL